MNRDGFQDLVYRVASTGDVYWEHFVLNSARTSGSWTDRKIATGWKTRTRVITPGDVNGDYLPDLLSVDSEAFSSRIKVRSAWTGYNAFDAVGDITGDGIADFLARTPGGTLYLYKGTTKATSEIFSARVSVGNGFQYYDIWG
ncbi:hypothetical protein [Streptomyces aureus]|uniref:hypothetical protein n=1 Tax=Streptomyces aureus TaxID=193461 RepID=UPI0036A24FD8